MPEATDQQMQQYSDTRVRPRCEQIRNLLAALDDDVAAIDDVYSRCVGSGNWPDARNDGPPQLNTCADILAWNTAVTALQKLRDGTFASVGEANAMFKDQWPVIQDLCVRGVTE